MKTTLTTKIAIALFLALIQMCPTLSAQKGVKTYDYGALTIWDSRDLRFASDVSGDGIDDIVVFNRDGVYLSTTRPSFNGPSHGRPVKVVNNYGASHGWNKTDHIRTMADVNGDGRDDIVAFGNNWVFVSLANTRGTGFDPPRAVIKNFTKGQGWRKDRHPRFVEDVNGDGRADIVGFSERGVCVSLSACMGQNTHFRIPTVRLPTIFDPHPPTGPVTTQFASSDWGNFPNFVRTMADVNGDGRSDIVAFHVHGVFVSYSKSSIDIWPFRGEAKFDQAEKLSDDFGTAQGWDRNTRRLLADVNGDGRADIVGFAPDGVYVGLMQNRGFYRNKERWVADFGSDHGWSSTDFLTLHDMNSDGSADIVGVKGNSVYVGMSAALANTWDFNFFGKPSMWLYNTFNDCNSQMLVGTFNRHIFAYGGVMGFGRYKSKLAYDLVVEQDNGYFTAPEWRMADRAVHFHQTDGGGTYKQIRNDLGLPTESLTVSIGYGGSASAVGGLGLISGIVCSYNGANKTMRRSTFTAMDAGIDFSASIGGTRVYQETFGDISVFAGNSTALAVGASFGIGGSGFTVINEDFEVIGFGWTLDIGVGVKLAPKDSASTILRAIRAATDFAGDLDLNYGKTWVHD